MITAQDERDFAETLLPASLLEAAIDWIQSNLDPEDVFTVADLKEWAKNNGFTEEML